jgi:integrase
MATVNLIQRGNTNPSNISMRFSFGRNKDLWVKTNILINPKHWDKKNQKLRNLITIPDRDTYNSNFDKLKIFVFDEYNKAFITGEIIDKPWLEGVVSLFFNRPKQEKNQTIREEFVYYSVFADFWNENKAPTWKTGKNKFLSSTIRGQNENFVEKFKLFEGKKRIKIKDIDSDKINSFITHMEETQKYSPATVKRHIGRLRFFLNRAENLDISINKGFKDRVFVDKDDSDIMEPYLNKDEIQRIYNFDFSHDEHLDSVRDNFIIGLWTGLRVSDFNKNLEITNIKDDYIEIKTQKTGTWVSIPLHPHIKAVLKKRFGTLPRRISDQKFNIAIKTICALCDIDEIIKGKLFDTETKRNKIDFYPKHKLVSSHICRKSFATNLYGEVGNNVIQAIGGWSTEGMMLNYIKRTTRESADVLKQHWADNY